MSDLKLLPPEKATPLERLLLEASSSEAPSAEQRARVRQALGLPAAIPAPLPTPWGGTRLVWLKVASAGLVAISLATLWLLSRTAQPVAPSSASAVSTASARAVAIEAQKPSEPSTPAAARALAPEAPSRAPRPSESRTAAVESGTDLSEQLRLIDAARAGVAKGNASSASSALNDYGASFPHGAFAQEAAVLRIQTLDLQGNHAQAQQLARAFLARHPNSPHVSVVQALANPAP